MDSLLLCVWEAKALFKPWTRQGPGCCKIANQMLTKY